ncbi:MAG: M3 family oligoendopeptidase, partial [Mesotoga sp.]
MEEISLKRLQRRYVGSDIDLSLWENLESELKRLEEYEIVDRDSLENFLLHWSELFMILQEKLAWKYIDMTRFADNEKKRLDYSKFFEDVYSKAEPYRIRLMKKYYDSIHRRELDPFRYENFDAIVSNAVELFNEDNLSLEVQEKKMASEYAATIGSITAEFRGKEYTLS